MESYQIKMKREIELRGLSERTKQKYLQSIKNFVDYFGKDPETISLDEIKDFLQEYQGQIAQGSTTKRAPHSVNAMKAVISFYYDRVLQKSYYHLIPNMKCGKKMPVILTVDEVKSMINGLQNYFWKAVVMTLYSTGIRNSELRNLKTSDIDSKRMVIIVRAGKGNKDREVILTKELLKALRNYWTKHRSFLKTNSDYLFVPRKNTYNGKLNKSLSHTALGHIVNQAAKIAGVKKKLPHMF
jgi:integrase/recombinase XerD